MRRNAPVRPGARGRYVTWIEGSATAIIFCALAAGYCISLIIKGFAPTGESNLKPVKAISAPVKIRAQATTEAYYEKDREKVARLRHYLDSLKRDYNGTLQYDSLQKLRPGLLDAL